MTSKMNIASRIALAWATTALLMTAAAAAGLAHAVPEGAAWTLLGGAALLSALFAAWAATGAARAIGQTQALARQLGSGDLALRAGDAAPGDVAELQATLIAAGATLHSLVERIADMAGQHNLGDIDVVIDATRFDGELRRAAQGINEMVGSHIAAKKKAMACIAEFGRGNFAAPMEKLPGKKAFINETIEQVRGNLTGLISELNHMSA